jgi:hypothetical protein
VLNTAVAAKKVQEEQDKTQAAIASRTAGELYELKELEQGINNEKCNTTRFIVLAKAPVYESSASKISLMFEIPHVSGSLYNILGNFHPFNSGTNILDLEDFAVSNCLLPLGSLIYVLFCTSKSGWGFDNFLAEANSGRGMKLKRWMRPYMTYVLPLIIITIFIIGIVTFEFSDGFTIWSSIKNLMAPH